MEEIRFRNHYSVVLEKMSGFVLVIVLLLVQNVESAAEMLKELKNMQKTGDSLENGLFAVLVLAGMLLIAGIIVLVNSMIWSKTWITITDTTIIMERNTINKMRNTIGMKNISNVNIEQNILEKILGTCKVKLDTNSLSTANTTDVTIVLKRKRALEIQNLILTKVNALQGQEASSDDSAILQGRSNHLYDVIAEAKDIFIHGICCINITMILVLVGCITGSIGAFVTFKESITESLITFAANFILILGVMAACIRSLAGGFITYHDFKVGRRGDKLYIHYGLFRTIDYTIPVSKINGVVIHQTLIARMMKRYMVELVNVGMGDEKQEEDSYIILACNGEQLREQLQLLLPEFAAVPIEQIEPQPKAIIWNKMIKTMIFAIVVSVIGVICKNVIPEVRGWMVGIPCVVLIGYGILLSILEYRTAGIYFDEKQILVANGCFRRDISIMPYTNIQYLKFETNFILNHWGLTKGTAHLLATMANQTKELPVFEASRMEGYIQKNYIRSYKI